MTINNIESILFTIDRREAGKSFVTTVKYCKAIYEFVVADFHYSDGSSDKRNRLRRILYLDGYPLDRRDRHFGLHPPAQYFVEVAVKKEVHGYYEGVFSHKSIPLMSYTMPSGEKYREKVQTATWKDGEARFYLALQDEYHQWAKPYKRGKNSKPFIWSKWTRRQLGFDP